MDTCLRLVYVLLIALLGVMGPPGRSPGYRHDEIPSVPTVKCPKRRFRCGEGWWRQKERRYECDLCGKPFNYCIPCDLYFSDEKSGQHNDHLLG